MSELHRKWVLYGALTLALLAGVAYFLYSHMPVVINLPPQEPVASTTTVVEPSGQIDEHLFIDNTPIVVNFCGNKYLAKQIKLDGVDIVQRIAYLATNRLFTEYNQDNDDYGLCAFVDEHFVVNSEIQANLLELLKSKSNLTIYDIGIANHSFKINMANNGIYYGNGINSLVGPIGYLK